jgi:glycerate dehydrogenase
MKIVFLDASTMGDDVSLAPLETMGKLVCYPLTDPDLVPQRISDADVVIVNKIKIGKREIDSAPSLRLICVAATGINNIDSEYAHSRGIPVMNVADYSTESVAQVTFASLLSFINRICYFDNVVKSGNYSSSPHFTDTGKSFYELKGKKFGIIGMGNIGKRVASIAESFGCDVSYFSTGGKAHYRKYPAVSLNELLAKCDIISIHAPLNERTRDLITLSELKEMKPSGIIMNMGRGGIVNENDLARALDFGLIAGAVVDVYEEEPIPKDHPYLQVKESEKLVLTPHIGWASQEARRVLVQKLADNIKSFLNRSGEEL